MIQCRSDGIVHTASRHNTKLHTIRSTFVPRNHMTRFQSKYKKYTLYFTENVIYILILQGRNARWRARLSSALHFDKGLKVYPPPGTLHRPSPSLPVLSPTQETRCRWVSSFKLKGSVQVCTARRRVKCESWVKSQTRRECSSHDSDSTYRCML